MRIWIDFVNTPQVNFFEGIVGRLINENHEIVLTCRDSSNTVDLLELKGWNYSVINGYSGSNTFLKYFLFPLRLVRLFLFIRRQRIDAAICQSSFYLPIVSWLLRIPSTYTNDNEHARGNLFGFLFANRVFLPEALKAYVSKSKLPRRNRIRFYDGVKEGIYLCNNEQSTGNLSRVIENIFYRPEPMTAQYYSGPLFQHDELLIELAMQYNVTIIPRGGKQLDHYMDERFQECAVLSKAIDFRTIVKECDLFIGGGGSMTRELAVLGKNVISTYAGELLSVDLFLIELGLMRHMPELDVSSIRAILSQASKGSTEIESQKLLAKGKLANDQLYDSIFEN